jgi:aminoglycoside 2''-phosphotransferase
VPRDDETALSERSIREHAGRAGLDVRELTELGAGADSACYLADGDWVLRFPITADAQRTLRTELALLPDLMTALPSRVPRFEHLSRDGDTVRMASYRLLAGAPLTGARLEAMGEAERTGVLDQLAQFLSALHAYPVDRATSAGVSAELTKGGYHCSQRELPRLLEGTLSTGEVRRLEHIFVRHECVRKPVLLHCDLKPDHVLYDGRTRRLAVIDWGDASLGEPDFDLAIIGLFFGDAFLRALLARMPQLDPQVVLPRARFFQLLRFAQEVRTAERQQGLAPGVHGAPTIRAGALPARGSLTLYVRSCPDAALPPTLFRKATPATRRGKTMRGRPRPRCSAQLQNRRRLKPAG